MRRSHRENRSRGAVSTKWWRPYLLLLPGTIFLVLFTVYPMISAAWMSLHRINVATRQQMIWAGLENFRYLFNSPVFVQVMKNTALYALGTVPISVGLGMFLAIQLNKQFRGNSLFRTLFFYPTVIPMMSVATIWLFMYTPEYGVINRILTHFGMDSINFLGNPNTALPALMVVSIWKDAGYFMIFFLAGLQNLSTELYEAAELDGASGWQLFRRITFPLLMPTTLFVSSVALINTVKTVDQVFLMTSGGPNNRTNILLYHLYEQAFIYFDRGKAAALTVILVVILLILAIIQNQWLDKKVHYQ